MSSRHQNLIDYVSDIRRRNHASASALIIMQNSKIVLEHYEGTHSNEPSKKIDMNSMFNVASARKSYLALAISFALYEKKIHSLDDPIEKYLSDYDKKPFRGTTIRHLATHSHGLDEQADGMIIREFNAGEKWAYRGINVRILTELFRHLYGLDFTRFLKERVFIPLGMEHTIWATSPSPSLVKVIDSPELHGEFKLDSSDDGMGSNLHTTARELAMWGDLHLQMGSHEGIQVVPEAVIKTITTIQNSEYDDNRLPDNGLFWYVQNKPRVFSEIGEHVPKGAYQILGNTGPLLLVVPENNLVVVRMSNKRYNYGGDNYLHYIREFSDLAYQTIATRKVMRTPSPSLIINQSTSST